MRERHGFRCCVPWCRATGHQDIHHVIKRSQGGDDSVGSPMAGNPGNLVPLCRPHHQATDLPKATRLVFAPVSSDPPIACGFYVRDLAADRSGFISLLAAGGAIHETF